MKSTLEHMEFGRASAPKGWDFVGFDDPHYVFVSGNYQDGFREMLLLEEDMTPRNIARMVELGMTRTKGKS